jgi:hypothetical protein
MQLAAHLTVTQMHAIDRAWMRGELTREAAIEDIHTELEFYKLAYASAGTRSQMTLLAELNRN